VALGRYLSDDSNKCGNDMSKGQFFHSSKIGSLLRRVQADSGPSNLHALEASRVSISYESCVILAFLSLSWSHFVPKSLTSPAAEAMSRINAPKRTFYAKPVRALPTAHCSPVGPLRRHFYFYLAFPTS
jgi:hypothetical protein